MIPGVQIINCEVGDGKMSSIFMNMKEQIEELSTCINNDKRTVNGFIGLGVSQGGFLMRGYLQYHNHHRNPMKRYVGLAPPIGGLYCGNMSDCNGFYIPSFVTDILHEIAYSEFI